MVDIVSHGDKYKRIIKIAEGWLRRKLGASVEQVHEDMTNCGNPIFSRVTQIINKGADEVKEKYQERMIRDFGELFLWILYKDTAYRDVAIWMLYQMLHNSDEMKKELEDYVKDPDDWYVNSWHESKEHTKKMQEEGKIPKHRKSVDEYIFTPPIQQKMLNKYKKKK
jgi:hypothetical protein